MFDSPAPIQMNASVEVVKLEMVTAHQATGTIDIADWVGRYPLFRDELVEFWSWLVGTEDVASPAEATETAVALSPADLAGYSDAVRDACLAVSFGSGMLMRESPPGLEQLGAELERARSGQPALIPKSKDFSRAVVYTWIVRSLERRRPRVTRLASQKVSYLLESALELGLFDGHKRNRLGPYDPAAKYRDAEPIAQRKGWLRIHGATLAVTDRAVEIDKYVSRYLRNETAARRLVDYCAQQDEDALEVLATVLPLARELLAVGKAPSVEAVRGELSASHEWRAKLARPHFAPPRVAEALTTLRALRLF